MAYYGPDAVRLSPDAADAFIADVASCDERLTDTIARIAHGASYADAVEETLAGFTAQGWSTERAERVREYLRHRTEEQYGAWIADLDAHGLDDDAVDGDEVVFPDGYDRLGFGLAAGLEIRLDTPVARIEWADARAAKGVAADADQPAVTVCAGAQRVTAHQIVVTVPVGVLRAGELEIHPPLPEPVSGALDRLEMNAFEKVFLRFPSRFWDPELYAFRRQGEAGRWWHSWYDLTEVHGEPTLLTFAAGPCARETRDWGEARVVASVLDALRELFGDAVPDPTHTHLTRWQDDPWARGSYAYMTVGSVTADHELLATPVGGVLHLAGEATWEEDPATVTAALCSGHRAAERILGTAIPLESLAAPLRPRAAPDQG